MKAYVIMGMVGEYSDHDYWLVKSYMDEGKAREHVENASRRSKEIWKQINELEDSMEATWDEIDRLEKSNEYDPHMKIRSFHYVTYIYGEVELE